MKLSTRVAYVALFLFSVGMGGFGGCFLGSNVGLSMDKKNGTFGKGMEGSGNEIGLMLLGWIVGIVVGIVIFNVIYRKRHPK